MRVLAALRRMWWAQLLLLLLVAAGATGALPSEAAVCAADCGGDEQDSCPPFCTAGPCANVLTTSPDTVGVLQAAVQVRWRTNRIPAPASPTGAGIDHPPRG